MLPIEQLPKVATELSDLLSSHNAKTIGTRRFREAVERLRDTWRRAHADLEDWDIVQPPVLHSADRLVAYFVSVAERRAKVTDVRRAARDLGGQIEERVYARYEETPWHDFIVGYEALSDDEKQLFDEAFRAIMRGCHRAAIVLMWGGCAYRLRDYVENTLGFFVFNSASKAVAQSKRGIYANFGRAYQAGTRAELDIIPDAHLLLVLVHVGGLDTTQYAALSECLNRRHSCAHPGRYAPGLHKCMSQAEDIFSQVILNKRLQ